jgi:Glucose / Sorbosone dehydrogenase
MGLPYTTHHAGQVFFGPTDGYLYYSMGDGGNTGDPWNFAQNKKSVLGKILRFNVDVPPSMFSSQNLFVRSLCAMHVWMFMVVLLHGECSES